MEAVSPKDQFLASLEQPAANDGFAAHRAAALKALESQEIPTTRVEAWKYTRVAKFFKKEYLPAQPNAAIDLSQYLIPGLESHKLVFVDGHFRADLSDDAALEGITIMPLSQAAALETVKAHYNTASNLPDDVFTSANTAYATDGAVMHVNAGHAPTLPVEFIIINAQQQHAANTRNLLVFDKNVEASAIFRYVGAASGSFHNAVTEIVVGENAHVECTIVQETSIESANINRMVLAQAANSTATVSTITLDGGFVRNDLRFDVNGSNCTTNLYGLYPIRGKQHVDNHTIVDHKVPHCESNEHYKGILNDQSSGVFNGKVFVRQDAQKTNAFQSNQNILLTDTADMNSKPELEIYADDVKCSHGSTTGQFDEEAVFYLRSRGITEDNARMLLIQAFAEDVLSNVSNEPLRNWLSERVAERFES